MEVVCLISDNALLPSATLVCLHRSKVFLEDPEEVECSR
jgi:hypothetical protein